MTSELTITRNSEISRCVGATAGLLEIAANALLPHVPQGVANKSRFAEIGASVALRVGRYTLPGIVILIREETPTPGVDLSSIPLPDRRTDVTIVEHDELLPTWPGYAPGIVYADDSGRTTVQCAVCLRTATGSRPSAPIIHAGWHHEQDTLPGERDSVPGYLPYKRCRDCRSARRHTSN